MDETGGGVGFVLQLLGGGAAGIDHERDGEGLLGLVLEDGDLLFGSVVVDFEIGFLE